jgi:signal transduction histidine kinase
VPRQLIVDSGVTEVLRDEDTGPLYIAVAPITGTGGQFGALTVRRARGPFDDEEMALLALFAGGVSDALSVARARDDLERLRVLEVRQQIARDLHDEVIQDLIGLRFAVDGLVRHAGDPAVARQLRTLGEELTVTTKRLRDVVAGLETVAPQDFGDEVHALIGSRAVRHGIGWTVELKGSMDSFVDDERAEVLRVLNEALSNVVRHADATQVDVALGIDDTRIELRVDDDGVGPAVPSAPTGMGLRNMQERARARDGDFALRERTGGGTSLVWCIPRSPSRGAPAET